jgi:hypothetical protein
MECGTDRRHARAEGLRRLGTFELGDDRAQLLDRRIAQP